jgi:bacillithiol biosynthesis deacetylase BshB1
LERIDCLAFGPHPDDVELFCGGLLLKLRKQGYKTAVVDLTKGELSTNGDIVTRQKEANKATQILGLHTRVNLALPETDLESDSSYRFEIIKIIRQFLPKICLVPYWKDRHPGHESASRLIKSAIFDSGLIKIDTGQEIYRPETILYYMLHHSFIPSFIVDISEEMRDKLTAIKSYSSQFLDTSNSQDQTFINRPAFIESIETRAAFLGQQIGAKYGEGYHYEGVFKINNIIQFFS